MKSQSDYEEIQKQKTKLTLLKTIFIKESTGHWSNNIPVYKEHIINRIKEWLNGAGNDTAKQARKEGWLSITNGVGYEDFTIPDRPFESLVGYLNIVLQRQYFLFYGIGYYHINSSFEGLKGVEEWLHSHPFRNDCFNMPNPEVKYKPEHFEMIRKRVRK